MIVKDSGILLINFPISGSDIDVDLLTGFIQANITFSESGGDSNYSNYATDFQFYELQYKTFNVLLRNGKFVRICLVTDHKPSERLRSLVIKFLREYEIRFKDDLIKVITSGALDPNDSIDLITEMFDVKLVFPMVLKHTFLPDDLDLINDNFVQKAIIQFAKKYLVTKHFFFINNLLNKVKKIVNLDAKIILYEIYQLLNKNIIIPMDLNKVENKIKNFNENRAQRIADSEVIKPLISNDVWMEKLKIDAKQMDENTAKNMIRKYIQKGVTAEKAMILNEALSEYEKALFLATGFDIEPEIGKISFMIIELDRKIKKLRLEKATSLAKNLEKKKDYIGSIKEYQKMIKILNEMREYTDSDNQIKKIEKKISKLQLNLRAN